MNRLSKMKFPIKIQRTKYIPLTIQPASERIALYIIGGQLSILIIQKEVTKALLKVSKFERGTPSSKLNLPPKNYIPSSAKIKINRIISIDMQTNYIIDRCITAMITCMESKALNSLATLNTLNVLNILIVLKAERLLPPPFPSVFNELITSSTILISTTPPSI